jgi:hypothetical protein
MWRPITIRIEENSLLNSNTRRKGEKNGDYLSDVPLLDAVGLWAQWLGSQDTRDEGEPPALSFRRLAVSIWLWVALLVVEDCT